MRLGLFLCGLFVPFTVQAASTDTPKRGLGVRRTLSGRDTFGNPDSGCGEGHCRSAGAVAESGAYCRCQCPKEAPIFLHNRNRCVHDTGECAVTVGFGSEEVAPTVFLPIRNHILEPESPLDWPGAGVRPKRNGSVPCIISNVGVLTEIGWKLINRNLFGFSTTGKDVFLKWLGNGAAGEFLEGKLVQVSLQCAESKTPCIFFRVIGTDAVSSLGKSELKGADVVHRENSIKSTNMTKDSNTDVGLIVGIVCGSLLVLTLLGVLLFWALCWRQQKERLLRKVHLHYLYQQRLHAAQQSAAMAAGYSPDGTMVFEGGHSPMGPGQVSVHGQPNGDPAASPHDSEAYESQLGMEMREEWLEQGGHPDYQDGPYLQQMPLPHHHQFQQSSEGMGEEGLPPPPPYPHLKKKLYFSPEFFEPHNMADPPPVAEEFLFEVRRMIDVAKGRIRARRYITSMFTIPEEGSSQGEAAVEGISEGEEEEGQRSASGSPPISHSSSGGGGEGGLASDDSAKGSLEKDSGTGSSIPSGGEENDTRKTEAVSDWLRRLPSAPVPSRHSRLLKNFAARQLKRRQPPPPVDAQRPQEEVADVVEMESIEDVMDYRYEERSEDKNHWRQQSSPQLLTA